MMREILGDLGKRPYLDARVFRYREERRAVRNHVVAGGGDEPLGHAPCVLPRVVGGRLINAVVDRALDWLVGRRRGGRMLYDLPRVPEKLEDARVAITEARHTPQAKTRRVDPRSRKFEPAVAVIVKRAASVALEHDGIVADVVAEKHCQDHDIGGVIPYFALERNEFLRGAVAVDAEINRLDTLALERRAVRKLSLDNRDQRFVLWHLDRLDVRIAKNRDANRVGWFALRVVGSAETVVVNSDGGFALPAVESRSARLEAPSAIIVVAIEVWKPVVGDTDTGVGNNQCHDESENYQPADTEKLSCLTHRSAVPALSPLSPVG